MEKSLEYFKKEFQLEDRDLRSYSPLTLAYLGDAVYEIMIRTSLVKKGNCAVNKLHKKSQQPCESPGAVPDDRLYGRISDGRGISDL